MLQSSRFGNYFLVLSLRGSGHRSTHHPFGGFYSPILAVQFFLSSLELFFPSLAMEELVEGVVHIVTLYVVCAGFVLCALFLLLLFSLLFLLFSLAALN